MEDTAARLGELKVEIGYIRRDVDELRDFTKDARKEFAAVRTDMSVIKEELAKLNGALSAHPTYLTPLVFMTGMIGIVGSVVLFADRLKHTFGIGG